jgi:hypothetical protein
MILINANIHQGLSDKLRLLIAAISFLITDIYICKLFLNSPF